jgi:hypothetical protein
MEDLKDDQNEESEFSQLEEPAPNKFTDVQLVRIISILFVLALYSFIFLKIMFLS